MIKKIINKFVTKSKNKFFREEIQTLHNIEHMTIDELQILHAIDQKKIFDIMLFNTIEQKYIYDITSKIEQINYDKYSKISFLLFNYFLHIPMFSGRINMGDYVQTIAVKQILDTLYQSDYIWYDRDSISCFKLPASDVNKIVCCIMQGWFSYSYNFLPSSDILPVWIGTHFTSNTQSFIRKVLVVNPNYFSSPVGCRDLFTLNFCRKNHINSYFSRCLTLTYPSRDHNIQANKVYIVDVPDSIIKYIPKNIRNDAILCNQKNVYVHNEYWTESLKRTQNQLNEYKKNARLVITTALHCACPCIAMGIPVILIAENPIENSSRFSALSGILNPILITELKENKINWDPEPIDISELKKAMIKNVLMTVDEVLNMRQENKETRDVRDFIENFRI